MPSSHQVFNSRNMKESLAAYTDVNCPGVLDKGDPNYEGAEEEDERRLEGSLLAEGKVTFISSQNSHKHLHAIAEEYLASEDLKSCLISVEELDSCKILDDFVERSIRLSLSKGLQKERLIDELLLELNNSGIVSLAQFERAFEKLVLSWEDLCLDVPETPEKLYRFIKFSILHKILPETFYWKFPEGLLAKLVEKQIDQNVDELSSHLDILRNFKKKCRGLLEEYLAAEGGEGASDIVELLKKVEGFNYLKHEFARLAIVMAIGRSSLACEGISRLFSDLNNMQEFSTEDFSVAFSRLLGGLDDILIDVPKASETCSLLIARAIEDEVLPPAFSEYVQRLRLGGDTGVRVAKRAEIIEEETRKVSSMRKRKTSFEGDHRWNELQELTIQEKWKKRVTEAVREFFESSHDAGEFIRFLEEDEDECEVPTGGGRRLSSSRSSGSVNGTEADVARKIIVGGIERTGSDCLMALKLIEKCIKKGVLSRDDISQGLQQIRDRFEDLKLDIPDLEEMVRSFEAQLHAKKLLASSSVSPANE